MRIDILTLFPEMFQTFKTESIIKRAIEKDLVEINIIDFRKYSKDPHQKVDDTPYGGGSGMVLMCQPIYDCIESIKKENSKVIMLTPDGTLYKQKIAYDLAQEKHLILLCGHYEGFDERIRNIVDMEISIGDYVLTGGEIPAMVVSDSVIRLVDGVIDKNSHLVDSFNDSLLDYETYTKPYDFRGMKVPDVLISGDHKKIDDFRRNSRYNRTKDRRPDLLEK
ncbi:tRNA (guanosine(37)-N1)-methyltransferase TrmD [bacterium]|jgi:tRNA (guanine-N(1)-)-methyltransferase|nr:tRNA (guanosine(37)-N1)-methyltransferase TrmD [bacterium]